MNHFMADATKFPRTDCSTIIVGKMFPQPAAFCWPITRMIRTA